MVATRNADETHAPKQQRRDDADAAEADSTVTANPRGGPTATATRAGTVPLTHPFAHFTGAGFFLINTNGLLAGIGKNELWQDFGERRDNNESPIQTATRELQEETGIGTSTVRILALPHWVRKDHHVYAIHIARVADEVWPRRSKELMRFKEPKQFSSGFKDETRKEAHRRVLGPVFLEAAGRIHAEIERNARAAQRSAQTATLATAQVRMDLGRKRDEGSVTSVTPETPSRVAMWEPS